MSTPRFEPGSFMTERGALPTELSTTDYTELFCFQFEIDNKT
jgi:hypothetical protein